MVWKRRCATWTLCLIECVFRIEWVGDLEVELLIAGSRRHVGLLENFHVVPGWVGFWDVLRGGYHVLLIDWRNWHDRSRCSDFGLAELVLSGLHLVHEGIVVMSLCLSRHFKGLSLDILPVVFERRAKIFVVSVDGLLNSFNYNGLIFLLISDVDLRILREQVLDWLLLLSLDVDVMWDNWARLLSSFSFRIQSFLNDFISLAICRFILDLIIFNNGQVASTPLVIVIIASILFGSLRAFFKSDLFIEDRLGHVKLVCQLEVFMGKKVLVTLVKFIDYFPDHMLFGHCRRTLILLFAMRFSWLFGAGERDRLGAWVPPFFGVKRLAKSHDSFLFLSVHLLLEFEHGKRVPHLTVDKRAERLDFNLLFLLLRGYLLDEGLWVCEHRWIGHSPDVLFEF
jgi:hypothetical protein